MSASGACASKGDIVPVAPFGADLQAREQTMTTPQEAPHFTREWLIGALRYVRGDFEAAISGDAGDDRARSRLDMARRLGLDAIADEVMAAIDQGADDAARLEWPGGLELRYLALLGALKTLAGVSSALNDHTDERPHLTYLAEAMAKAELAAGSGRRRREAECFRGLYVIIDPSLTNGRDARWVAEEAVCGGATAIQLRVKDADKGDWLQAAIDIRDICNGNGAAFIVNDHPDVAVAVEASGAHLGQHDLPLAKARQILRPWQIAGTSNALAEEAKASYEAGADYIAVGRMFPTGSKSNTRPAGPETLRAVRDAIPIGGPPVLAIGGITPENAAEIAKAGADCICVIAAVTQADAPREAAERLLAAFQEAR